MAEATTNEVIIQPNQYAGGIPAPPFSMPNAKILPSDPGGAPSSGSQGQGGSDLTMDGNVSMSGPGTHLQGTQQNTDPTQSGDAQPTNPGSDFQDTVTNTKPGINQVGGSGPASSGTATGWCKSGNDWYYIDPETGKLATGWKFIGNRWYYLDPETGVMVTGWVMSKGLWYYLEPGDGHMLTDWQTINGNEYYLETDNGNGNMVTGWKWCNDAWYFLHEDGAMAYGDWLMIDEKWYYFHPDGRMAALEIAVYDKNGEKYYLGADGAMITSAIIQRVTYNGIVYDVAEDGVCTAITMPRPADANIAAWRSYIRNDQTLSVTRKEIVLEGFRIIEQGCIYHQLRKNLGTPNECGHNCDHAISDKQTRDYDFASMANYNLENPMYLDCSFFIKHCYWKAGIEMSSYNTDDMYSDMDFIGISKDSIQAADIAVRQGHVLLFVGWTSGHAMVWAEMKDHKHDGVVSLRKPSSSYKYKKLKNL